MMRSLPRLRLSLLLVLAVVLLSGCAGNTTTATSITTTSATLGAQGSCDTQCWFYFNVYEFGTGRWVSTAVKGPIGRVQPAAAFTDTVTGLSPGRDYAYQVCGYGDGLTRWVCVGSDGSEKTRSYFSTPSHPASTLAAGVTTLRSGALGRQIHDQAIAGGATLVPTTATSFADYSHPNVRVNPVAVPENLKPGVIGHEMSHALIHQRGVLGRLNQLPDNLGAMGNEVVAEMLASAAAKQAGWARGGSAVTTDQGALRSARGALDNILTSSYVSYYGINLANVSDADRRLASETIYTEASTLIRALGGTVPAAYDPSPPAPCGASRHRGSSLAAGGVLTPNDYLQSPDGRYRLVFQCDSNLVLYFLPTGRATWFTGTSGKDVHRVAMQGDGNLIMYDAMNGPAWATYRFGAGARLTVQNDGNVVVYGSAGVIWHAASFGRT
jgi:hypothetical protein